MKQISYPKIGQFRNVITTLSRISSFKGMDVNGNPIYDETAPKPKIKFKGTVKIHGTNAGVCYNAKDGIYTQSRNNPFDMEKMPDSHMGFTFFVKKNIETFGAFFDEIIKANDIDPEVFTVSIYGEWAGKGIQKGVAVSELDKAFYLFGVKISKPSDPEFDAYWVDYTPYSDNENRIFNIDEFGTYEVEVDFGMPQMASNKFSELTIAVEDECPVGKHFGVSGVGEGIVWVADFNGSQHRFKVKGEKHSVSKVKTLAPVDTEKLNSIKDFVQYAATENRFNQGVKEVFGEEAPVIQKMGDLIRWVVNDIMSEEIDTMAKNNLEPKDVNKYISNEVRAMFQKLLNENAGL
jgi:hypothetical protein